ncbi:hypothetical protein [Aliarcobacter lanthieri]|uniref:hypothetical protein n=1 Tax=Aliarcobacter lanthieri TaxID=1355374 RepID=UPI0004AE9C60|nr:hypothetical protein [Aliarcobacter lanthieri]
MLFYVFFTYFVQMILIQFLRDSMNELYNGTELSVYYTSIVVIIFFFVTIFIYIVLPTLSQMKLHESFFKILLWIALIISIIYFISSLDFFINYNISFRHKVRIRDANFLVQILFSLMLFIKVIVFMILVFLLKNKYLLKIQKYILFLILIGSIFSLNSSTDVILLFIVSMMLIFPSIFYKKIKIFNLLILTPIIFLFLLGVVYIGLANKGGMDYANNFFSSTNGILKLSEILFTRISTSFMSLQNLLENHMFDLNLQLDTFISSYHIFMQKIKIILPIFDEPSRDILSVNRTNFLLLFKPFNDHAGASPGLLASIFYLPFPPISIFFISFYTIIVIGSINRYLKNVEKYNFITVFCIFFLLFMFFESPLSIISVLLPVNFALLIFVFGSFILFKERERYVEKYN